MSDLPFRIGTRSSRLALTQTEMVVRLLAEKAPELKVQVVEINTSGDWRPEQGELRLSEKEGGKGHFIKEIEQALAADVIDCGVHSLKDVPTFLPPEMICDHFLARADVRDVFISRTGQHWDELPEGAVIGTTSVRRAAFLLNKRPDFKVVPFRGNVTTRLEKLAAGQVDATFLAKAGLDRLGIHDYKGIILDSADFVPACGQGIIGLECRRNDTRALALLSLLNIEQTAVCARAEREVLAVLDGTCHTPIGCHATLNGNKADLAVAVCSLDGRMIVRDNFSVSTENQAQMLLEINARAKAFKAGLPAGILG